MNPSPRTVELDGISLTVVRKDVRHVRITVRRDGEVRVSAPARMRDATLLPLLQGKLPWVRRKLAEASARQQVAYRYATGETHWFLGRPYRLEVTEGGRRPEVLISDGSIVLQAPPNCALEQRADALERWYRLRLAEQIRLLLSAWEPRLGVKAAEVRIRKMTTRWGSCNTRVGRIWLNLDLIRRSEACLEYVLVHELVHLLEASHGPRFKRLMDEVLPGWRKRRAELSSLP